MVKLTVTSAAKAAIEEYCLRKGAEEGESDGISLRKLSEIDAGSAIEHDDLIKISQYLVNGSKKHEGEEGKDACRNWRLETLLKGASVYRASPPPKAEPTPQFKALMQRLRKQEEQRQYERMINPAPPAETFSQRFPHASTSSFNPNLSHGYTGPDEVDEVTYAEVNRQMILIINVLISIITCGVFIWYAARRWSVPQRLGLSMSGSGIVAFAEVAIYIGYIKRIKDAKTTEVKKIESKEIVDTWVIDKSTAVESSEALRYRKGKHR